ncbi:MAG: substrate-binding domain-containing protein [Clostridiales bacterium]|nr:substrate-binding domain-containing protein [Clostridiales bacterium]
MKKAKVIVSIVLTLVCLAIASIVMAPEQEIVPEKEYSITQDELARVDGSTATLPLTCVLAEDSLGIDDASEMITHNKTHNAFMNLTNGKADIAFITYPSEAELKAAADAGVELESAAVANDAFVFFGNKANTVSGLTSEQVRGIYSGTKVKWSEVGGEDSRIIAYQRNEGSGSQSAMERFMGKVKLSEPPTQYRMWTMSSTIDMVTNNEYTDAKNSIAYSYYYYVNNQYVRDNIKVFALDGVEPNNETIKNKTYPEVVQYYAFIRKDSAEDSFARRMLGLALSAKGQAAIEHEGYVGIK